MREICSFAGAQSGSLLCDGAPRAGSAEEFARIDREHQLEDRGDRAGRNFGLRGGEGSDPGAYARVGSGAAAIRNSRECGGARGSYDAALPAMAGGVSRSARKAEGNCSEDSPGETDDQGGRDRGHGAVPDFGASASHHGAAFVRGWRVRAFGSRADLTEIMETKFFMQTCQENYTHPPSIT